MEEKEIINPWYIYEGCSEKEKHSWKTKLRSRFKGPSCNHCGIAKIIEEHGTTMALKMSEKEEYAQLWERDFFHEWRYTTLEKAVKDYATIFKKSKEKVIEQTKKDFSSYFENKDSISN